MSNKTASEDLECAIPFCKRTGKEALIQSGEKRIDSLIAASKERNDGLVNTFEDWKKVGYIPNHKLCSCEYTSQQKISAAKKTICSRT